MTAQPPGIFTLGHSTRPIDEFVALLKGHGIDRLIDVRTVPRSRHNPQFNLEELSSSLANAGIHYTHMPGLGGLWRPRKDSTNTGWRNTSFRGYADYMQTPGFAHHLDECIALAATERVALMCAEAVPWRCHRSLIADALIARGIVPNEIVSPTRARPHTLTPFAVVAGTQVSYPSPLALEPTEPANLRDNWRGRSRRTIERGGPAMAGAPSAPMFYDDLAEWWPLFSPPSHYEEEAGDLLTRLSSHITSPPSTLLELGSGGGSLASHLSSNFRLTLSDRSEGMLEVSRRTNPQAEHVVGDMRTLRLGREFDVVLVHDAIMYATTSEDVRATLETAAVHCREDGTVIVLPDCVRETFEPGTEHGGEDAEDGRGFRYLEWQWDPNPDDHTYTVDYVFLMRDRDGAMSVRHERHVEGLFSLAEWLQFFTDVGLTATSSRDAWNRDVFVARRV